MEMVNTKTAFPKYLAYKDSGEYWMGVIPDHWETKKLKHLFTEKKITHNPNLGCGAISFGEVITKDDDKIPLSTKASYQEVLDGEFLVNPLNLNYDLKSLRIALSRINVVVSSGYIVLKDLGEINREYYRYLLHRYDVAYMKLLGSGVRQTINFNHVANSLLAYPPKEEQTAIANFLDDKTSKIDRAIAQKERMIELLKERKQIIIQNAVTKGLDPNVKMKDSGVEWIGEIPEHWEVKRLKYVADFIQTGTTPSTANPDFFDGQIDWYNPKDLNNEMLNGSEKTVSDQALKRNEIKMFLADSVLIVGIGATTGKTAYMLSKGAFNQQITGFHSKKEHNKYLFYFLKSMARVMLNVASYTTLPILNNEFFKSFWIVIPSVNEQQKIVAHIEAQSAKIDQAISLQQTQIEKLKEYKASLIDSAVTGKIKVC